MKMTPESFDRLLGWCDNRALEAERGGLPHVSLNVTDVHNLASFAQLALKAIIMLELASCPDDECGYGNCDWCCDRKRLLAALREAGFVE